MYIAKGLNIHTYIKNINKLWNSRRTHLSRILFGRISIIWALKITITFIIDIKTLKKH